MLTISWTTSIDYLLSFVGMSFLIRRQEENKNQTVPQSETSIVAEGPLPPPGRPTRQRDSSPLRPSWGVPVWGCEGKSAPFLKRWLQPVRRGGWGAGFLVNLFLKGKIIFKQIKRKTKLKPELKHPPGSIWHAHIHTCTYTHATTHVHIQKNKGTNFLWNKNSSLGKMGIQVNYIAAIGRKGSGSSLKGFYCFVLFFSLPSLLSHFPFSSNESE